MAIETLAARTGATPLRIRRVQKITLTLLFIAGIVNFLDRSSLSVAGEAIRADRALAPPSSGAALRLFALLRLRATALRYFVGSHGATDCAGRRADFLVRNAGPDRDGQFVLAFYSAAHWPRDRRSAVYASRREIDQRLVCAKRARHGGGNIQLLDGAGRAIARRPRSSCSWHGVGERCLW